MNEGEWFLFGFALIALILALVAWFIYIYPVELIQSTLDKLFHKKEWWQDRAKRIEKENENMIANAKSKKG